MKKKTWRDIVHERSDGGCEVRIPGVCQGRVTNIHHRKNKSQGGPDTVSNALALCGSGSTGCHGYITENRKVATEKGKGWAVKQSDDPAKVPFLHWNLGLVIPDEHGDFHFTDGMAEPTPCAKCGEVCDLPEMWATPDNDVECTGCHASAAAARLLLGGVS